MRFPFFSSCNPDRDKDGLADDQDDCPEIFAKTKNGCPEARELANVNFYLETSASMGGYFNQDAAFKTIVSDLSSKF